MNLRHAYQEHMSTVRAGLRAARAEGKTWLQVRCGSVDPSRMSDWDIEMSALRDAELTVNAAINQRNEQLAQKGR